MPRREGPNSNPEIQAKLRNRERLQEEQRRADLVSIMTTPGGRRFMYDLIFERCGLMNLYPAQDSGIYRHEGRRSVGWSLAAELQEHHGLEYVLMLTERQRDVETDRKIRQAAETPTAEEEAKE